MPTSAWFACARTTTRARAAAAIRVRGYWALPITVRCHSICATARAIIAETAAAAALSSAAVHHPIIRDLSLRLQSDRTPKELHSCEYIYIYDHVNIVYVMTKLVSITLLTGVPGGYRCLSHSPLAFSTTLTTDVQNSSKGVCDYGSHSRIAS